MSRSKRRRSAAITIAEYLKREEIEPLREIINLMPDLPLEMQAMLWRDILRHVDPPKPKPAESSVENNFIVDGFQVPKVIRQTHSEEELIRIASNGSNEPSDDHA